ncbi:MAG: outer membrane lipoprotein-sorting protein [Calditrichaceae bacterium]
MKSFKYTLCIILILLLFQIAFSQDAKSIVQKSNELLRSKSSYSELTMEVIKKDWSRKFTMKVWAIEPDYTLVLITAPASDKGSVTLKRKTQVWNWIPNIRKEIKIPPSMMLQSWMGIKEMDGRTIPTHWEMIPEDKPGQKTVMDYLSIEFNAKIKESFFSKQNMKRVR